MPCTYYETPEEIAAAKLRSEQAVKDREQQLKSELDLATDNLCFVLTKLFQEKMSASDLAVVVRSNAKVRSWWARHQEMDKKRLLHEKVDREMKAKKKEVAAVKSLFAEKRQKMLKSIAAAEQDALDLLG